MQLPSTTRSPAERTSKASHQCLCTWRGTGATFPLAHSGVGTSYVVVRRLSQNGAVFALGIRHSCLTTNKSVRAPAVTRPMLCGCLRAINIFLSSPRNVHLVADCVFVVSARQTKGNKLPRCSERHPPHHTAPQYPSVTFFSCERAAVSPSHT